LGKDPNAAYTRFLQIEGDVARMSQGFDPIHTPVHEPVEESIVLDCDGNLLAFVAILRHSPVVAMPDEVAEGSRTAAAIAASQFGIVLKVSEDGRLSFYKSGHCVWNF
jgi:hypothetical protein